MTRIYIAGPMRGYADDNFPAFERAAARFRALGHDVVSPHELTETVHGGARDLPPRTYMQTDIAALITCDAIALLPGWERSTGARCEATIAVTLGLAFFHGGMCVRTDAPARIMIDGGYEKPPGACESLDQLAEEIRAWQRITFPHATPSSVAEHLWREAGELKDAPEDESEKADIFHLFVNAMTEHTVDAIREKFEQNKRRVWGVPDAHGVVEHVAEAVS